MANQIYKVRDQEGNIREISGPAGASDNVVIAKAQELFSKINAKSLADQIPEIQPIPEAQPTPSNLQVGINAANKGIAGVPDFLLNTPNSLINLGKAAYGTAATALGRSDLAPELTENPDYARKAMSAMGFIKPQFEPVTTGQRIFDIGVQGAVGAAMPQTSVSNLIKALTIGGASGAAAGGVKELTGSDAAAISAGLVTPAAALKAISAARPMTQALQAYGETGLQKAKEVPTALINALKSKPEEMQGMGAASVEQAALRQARANQLGLQLSKGEQMQDLATQQFESEIALQKPDTTGKPLIQFKTKQEQDILNKFQQMAEKTGAEFSAPDVETYRKIGSIVDKALVNEYDRKLTQVNTNYQKARDSGETKEVVNTAPLEQWLAANEAEAISVPQINSIKMKLDSLKKATNGNVTIDDIENLYQVAGKLGKPGEQSGLYMRDVKNKINEITEGVGGNLYREARASRAQLGTDFENNYRVAKLLGTKAGYADRSVALSDVFDHIILNGSLEEMQSVTRLLKKAGPEGEQAFKELQGQTIQYMRGQLTKNPNQMSFSKLTNTIDSLEREAKLDYLFGKKGSEEILNLRSYLQDALVKQPGAVNYAQSGNLIARALDKVESLNVIGLKQIAGLAKQMAETKKVKESVNYNALDQK